MQEPAGQNKQDILKEVGIIDNGWINYANLGVNYYSKLEKNQKALKNFKIARTHLAELAQVGP